MANFHSDEWVMEQIHRHYEEAKKRYPEERILGVFCQGSTNYGLDTPNSDIDTKCIVVPSFEEIALNKKLVSTTHVLDNDEHLDAKDIRLYIECFYKQNLNFLEILFTPYFILNPAYKKQWDRLVAKREDIAHMDPVRAVRSMAGMCGEKHHALQHPYPSKLELLAKHGYDPKQLSHQERVKEALRRYIAGEPYYNCVMEPCNPEYYKWLKCNAMPVEEAVALSNSSLAEVKAMETEFVNTHTPGCNPEMMAFLKQVQCDIMRVALSFEFIPRA